MMPAMCKRWTLGGMIGVEVAAAVLMIGSAAEGQFEQRLFRADDGTAYQVLWLLRRIARTADSGCG
jgi:hypothetical protein